MSVKLRNTPIPLIPLIHPEQETKSIVPLFNETKQSKTREGRKDSITTVNKRTFLSGWEKRRVWGEGHVRGDELEISS